MTAAGLLAAVFYAPALVAASVTAPTEPVGFIGRPWTAWAFATDVLVASVSAEAPSPGAALTRADRAWNKGDRPRIDPVEVKLLYLPGGVHARFEALLPDGRTLSASVNTPRSLVWIVMGRYSGSQATGTIGLLDFSTGSVLWDVRTAGEGTESNA